MAGDGPPTSVAKWFDLSVVKRDLLIMQHKSDRHALRFANQWTSELLTVLDEVAVDMDEIDNTLDRDDEDWMEDAFACTSCRTYFDTRDYVRVTYFTRNCKSHLGRYFHWYARYLAGEKQKLESIVDVLGQEIVRNEELENLVDELSSARWEKTLDGFGLYLYGVVLKRQGLTQKANEILQEAIRSEPLNWAAWLELSDLIIRVDMISELDVPNTWVKTFFLAQLYLKLFLTDKAMETYTMLMENGFKESIYVKGQKALAHHNAREVEQAVSMFAEIQKADPYRLDNLDTYSNLLYVKEMQKELCDLAKKACETDRYRVETNCVIGNFYSLRQHHEKAALYFQRALRLDPTFMSAWTLLGHEFMELKNTTAAAHSYRKAIELDPRDYRAWYGLGQTYEIMKMTEFSLYYYKQAQQLRPHDSRILVALGEVYERLDRIIEAKDCYERAYKAGDLEGTSLVKLANMFIGSLFRKDLAAKYFTTYVEAVENDQLSYTEELNSAYRYLAKYHLQNKNPDEALKFATKYASTHYSDEDANALLKDIAEMKEKQKEESENPDSMSMDISIFEDKPEVKPDDPAEASADDKDLISNLFEMMDDTLSPPP